MEAWRKMPDDIQSDPLLIIPAYIATKDHAIVLNRCIKSLRDSTEAQVLIIDDCSPFQEQANILYDHFYTRYDNIDVERNKENSGFSKTVNVGLKECVDENRDAVLVNADIEFFREDWLKNIYKIDKPIVGAKLLYENKLIQHAGIYFDRFSRSFDHRFKGSPPDLPAAEKYCQCPVTGALQFLRKDVLADIGLYDEEFRLGWEDVDYMIRAIDHGFISVYSPEVVALHHESLFRGGNENKQHKKWERESFLRLLRKWRDKDFADICPGGVH